MAKSVLIAGATGYLGRYLVSEYMKREWKVLAVVRNTTKNPPKATKLVQAEVTQPETLRGIMEYDGKAVDLVISAIGITRQRDGLTYQEVDYQANANLLNESIRANVPHFAYIHVLQGHKMANLPAIKAKQDFVIELERTVEEKYIEKATVICPCGFFSDMKDFLHMAKDGRVYLFGDGSRTINPIHGLDLAEATADAISEGRDRLDVGGPDVFTHTELATLAFDALGKPAKITYIWDSIRTALIRILPWITPLSLYGPAQFFLTAMGMNMIGECHGKLRLQDHFAEIIKQERLESANSNLDLR